MKLLVSEYEVEMANENSNAEFFVKFHGPKESPYEGVGNKAALWALFVFVFKFLIFVWIRESGGLE